MPRWLLPLVFTANAAFAVALGCSGTLRVQGQVMVQVDSDLPIPATWDTLLMHVAVRGDTRLDQRYPVGPTQLAIPATLDLLQGSDNSTPVTVTVTAQKGGVSVVSQRFTTTIPPARVALMRMTLNHACEQVTCPSDQTCADGVCVPQLVDPSTLPEFGADAGGISPVEGGADTEDASESASDSADGSDAPTVYADMTSPASWSSFDTATVNANASGFLGATFDGRYIYLAPDGNGIVTRYDTQASFAAATSWSTFDTTTVNASAKGFHGAAFDGRYLYLVPYSNGVIHGLITRYDTQASFSAATSWSTFDTTTVNVNAKGFHGAAFDGRYLYLLPYINGALQGLVTRYDTQASFTAAASWSTFDTSTVNAKVKGFFSAVFDGRYVYLVPLAKGAPSGIITRYDTQASFTAAASWSIFDTTTVNAKAEEFGAAAFDGRYVYLVPYFKGAPDGLVTRYDTQTSFTVAASWSTFDMSTVNGKAKNFGGAAFDGRYVYLVPYSNGAPDGLVTRYDTQTSFTAGASWSTFDTTTVNANAKGFQSAVFDGRYLYLVPFMGSKVARFDAKTPPSMPNLPAFYGSFF